MAKIITKSSDELRGNIFGPHETFSREFYHQGSANAQAQRMHTQGNPNYEPIPFVIPSRYHSDPYFQRQRQKPSEMSQQEWEETSVPPIYTIEGYNSWGGSINSNTATIEWKEFHTGIIINSCTFTDQVNIQYLTTNFYVRFYNCTFNNDFRLINIKAKEISFSNCNFTTKTLNISDCSIEKLILNSCSNIAVNIENNKKPSLSYSPNVITNDIDHQLPCLDFTDLNNCEKIIVSGQNIGKITFKDVYCKQIEFDVRIDGIQVINQGLTEKTNAPLPIKKFTAYVDKQVEAFISILENLHIHEFSLTGRLEDSTIIATAIILDKIQIKDFVNNGRLRFQAIDLKSDGELIRSQLGKAEFDSVNFKGANKFKIYLTNITEIVTTNTTFSENIIGKDEHDLEAIREIYRQLKNASGKQGDKVNELRYESIEMHVYEKLLSTKKFNSDTWILISNRWTNGHGQSWIRAGVILIVGSIVLFCLARLCLGYYYPDESLIFSTVADFFIFTFNPLHKFLEVFNESQNVFLTGLAKFIDVLARLFSGYMIFQFLRAFRKYAR